MSGEEQARYWAVNQDEDGLLLVSSDEGSFDLSDEDAIDALAGYMTELESHAPDAETLRGLLPASVYAYLLGHLMWLEQNVPQSGAVAMVKGFMSDHEAANRAALKDATPAPDIQMEVPAMEIQINRGYFTVHQASITGAELRQLPTPAITDDYDLWHIIVGTSEDIRVELDTKINLHEGRTRFITAPRVINPGQADALARSAVQEGQ